MAKATIRKIEFNAKKVTKAGVSYDGAYLSAQTEAGTFKKEFIFKKSQMHALLSELNVGDVVDLVYEKNGAFFNLKDIKPTGEKGTTATVSAPSAPPTKSGSTGWQASYGQTEDYIKHKDLMIIRQSTMKAAVDLVTAMMQKDMFKKTATPDFFVEEVGRIASKFEASITGTAAEASLKASVATLEASDKPEYDDDCPFPE